MSFTAEKPIVVNSNLIAYCGLYCGACRAYRQGRCPGCQENAKATWCSVRTCNREHQYASCADCAQVKTAAECRKFNNFMSKLFAFLLHSDRGACIAMIKEKGYPAFAQYMTENRLQTIRR